MGRAALQNLVVWKFSLCYPIMANTRLSQMIEHLKAEERTAAGILDEVIMNADTDFALAELSKYELRKVARRTADWLPSVIGDAQAEIAKTKVAAKAAQQPETALAPLQEQQSALMGGKYGG